MKGRTTIQFVMLSILLLLSSGALSESPDFLVEIKIIDSGIEIATPRMMIKEGSEASMSVSGENAVSVGLIVNSSNENEAHVMAEVESGGNTMSPYLLVSKGQWASVSVGEFEFHVRVEHLAVNK